MSIKLRLNKICHTFVRNNQNLNNINKSYVCITNLIVFLFPPNSSNFLFIFMHFRPREEHFWSEGFTNLRRIWQSRPLSNKYVCNSFSSHYNAMFDVCSSSNRFKSMDQFCFSNVSVGVPHQRRPSFWELYIQLCPSSLSWILYFSEGNPIFEFPKTDFQFLIKKS